MPSSYWHVSGPISGGSTEYIYSLGHMVDARLPLVREAPRVVNPSHCLTAIIAYLALRLCFWYNSP